MKSIGIIGYGSFGSLLHLLFSNYFPSLKLKVYSKKANIDNKLYSSLEDVLSCDLIIPAVPIRIFKHIISEISPKLKHSCVVMDVCSVKVFPVEIMKAYLPKNVTIVATHPLFGPGTIKQKSLSTTISFIRGSKEKYSQVKKIFEIMNIKTIEVSAKQHDRFISRSQFISHLVANTLTKYKFTKTIVDTKTSIMLQEFTSAIKVDKSLLIDIYEFNPYCKQEFERFKNSLIYINSILKK